MCRLRNIAMRDYQESKTTGQTQKRMDGETPDKVIPMCRYASQATQKMAHTLEKLCNDGKANAHMREPRLSPLLPLTNRYRHFLGQQRIKNVHVIRAS